MTKPAILGGTPAVTGTNAEANRWPILGSEERRAVLEVLSDGDLSFHESTRRLEEEYAAFFGRRFALAHCNGTAALLAAFFALGLEPGDEILVPSATFWASVVPMLWVGALPVFCESEPERMGLDPDDAEKKITSRTRALVLVHLWGMPCRLDPLLDLARRHNLAVVEDASHAHGARHGERPCGGFGEVSVFSLQTSKLAPAGEGGMLLTDEPEIFHQAVALGDMVRLWELEAPERRFAATTFGIKTRLAPLSAAVARVQLRRLEERNRLRRENLEYLSRRLQPLGVETFLPPAGVERTYFEFVVRWERANELPKDHLLQALRAEGCEVSDARYPLLHQQPLFTEGIYRRVARVDRPEGPPIYRPDALPRTEGIREELFRLPAFPRAENGLLDRYAEAFEKVVEHIEPIRDKLSNTEFQEARSHVAGG
jgi:perosamine synthetase